MVNLDLDNVFKYTLFFGHYPLCIYSILNKQFNANQMNKSRARIECVEFYTGPAFIHLVCIKLYI